MTEQDKDALIGKASRELAEALKEVALINARLRGIGEKYVDLGEALKSFPEKVLRNGEGIDGRFANSRVIIQTDFPSIDQAMELTKQLREQILKADRSQDELARYGIVQPMMSGRSR